MIHREAPSLFMFYRMVGDLVVSLAVQSQVPVDLPALLSLSVVAIAGSKSPHDQARPDGLSVEPIHMSILESGNRKIGT